MKTFLKPGNSLTVVAATDVTAGDGVRLGKLFGVAAVTAKADTTFVVTVEGVFLFPRPPGEVWATIGLPIYYDAATHQATAAATGTAIGYNTWMASGDGAPAPVKLIPSTA